MRLHSAYRPTIQFGSGDRFLLSLESQGFPTEEFQMISDRQLRKIIDYLRRLERKCFASRSRFAFYEYLAAVFELYVQLKRTKHAKKAARLIAKLFGLRNQDHRPNIARRSFAFVGTKCAPADVIV